MTDLQTDQRKQTNQETNKHKHSSKDILHEYSQTDKRGKATDRQTDIQARDDKRPIHALLTCQFRVSSIHLCQWKKKVFIELTLNHAVLYDLFQLSYMNIYLIQEIFNSLGQESRWYGQPTIQTSK